MQKKKNVEEYSSIVKSRHLILTTFRQSGRGTLKTERGQQMSGFIITILTKDTIDKIVNL